MSIILVVDDLKEVSDTITVLLQQAGYEVLSSENVPNAIQLLELMFTNEKTIPDLILCDVNLPFSPGVDLFNFTRSRVEYSSIPFIFKTFSDQAPNCQYNDIIQGQITQEKLLNVIKKWVSR